MRSNDHGYVLTVAFPRRCVLMLLLALPFWGAQEMGNVQARVQALQERAQRAIQQGKPQLAIPLLREIVSLEPGNVSAQGNLGVLLYFQGSYAEAIPPLRSALRQQPRLWKIEALLGIAEKRTGDPGRAREDLERAFSNLEDAKIKLETGLELIELDVASSHLDKALAVVLRLQEIAPEDARVLFVGYHVASRIVDRNLMSMMLVAPDTPEMHLMMGGEFARQGDHAKAIAQYREALRLNPKLPGAHFELAEQLRLASDPQSDEQAEEHYRTALQLNPYDERSWRQLAGMLAAKGDSKGAEEAYRKAIAIEPNDGDAKTGLAAICLSAGHSAEAAAWLESAIHDDPTNIVAHYRLSSLYRRTGRLADAERELEAFKRYKALKEKLGAAFKQLSVSAVP
jgi:Tfp pilus assembly protein PilF